MSINNPDEYCSNLWDWKILRGCFENTSIEPTDIDGLVERHGKFLLIETKSPGVEVKTGQMIAFKNLLSTKAFTVAIVWGEANQPQKIVLMTRKGTFTYDNASLDTLRNITKQWFSWANSTPPPKFEE